MPELRSGHGVPSVQFTARTHRQVLSGAPGSLKARQSTSLSVSRQSVEASGPVLLASPVSELPAVASEDASEIFAVVFDPPPPLELVVARPSVGPALLELVSVAADVLTPVSLTCLSCPQAGFVPSKIRRKKFFFSWVPCNGESSGFALRLVVDLVRQVAHGHGCNTG